jgi:hypothetical protein
VLEICSSAPVSLRFSALERSTTGEGVEISTGRSRAEKRRETGALEQISSTATFQTMRQIIEDNDLEVMAVNARYTCSYANIAKKAWWHFAPNKEDMTLY